MKLAQLSLLLGLIMSTNLLGHACFSSLCGTNCCTNINSFITDSSAPIPICTPSTTIIGTQYSAGTTVSCSCSTTSQSTGSFSGGGTITTASGNALSLTCTSGGWRNAQQGVNNLLSITCP